MDALEIAYNPVPMANRVASLRQRLFRAIASGIGLAVVWGVIYGVMEKGLTSRVWWTVGSILVISLILVVIWGVLLVFATRDLSRIGSGPALRISHRGIEAFGQDGSVKQLGWSQIGGLTARGSSLGHGPQLIINGRSGTEGVAQWKVPLSFLDALPGTIDSACRAYSGGRIGLDLSQLDSVF